MADNYIRVRGAKAHNLKNISVDIPKDKMVVITGLSGSGKSSLAFDTIYAEGQRRYVESLSAYARQFLGLMEKPDVDLIEGLSPAISIDQKSAGHNPRSTVGTITEVYDYLRLLYARVGHARSPVSGKRLKSQTVQEIVDAILEMPIKYQAAGKAAGEGVKIMLLAPLVKDRKGTYEDLFARYLAQGYVRARVDGQVYQLEEKIKLDRYVKHNIELVLDRLVIRKESRGESEFVKRLTDSVELTLNLGEREMLVNLVDQKEDVFFSERLVDPATGQSFPEIEPHTFSFNSPHGACPSCNGLGFIKEVDPRSVFDNDLSIEDGGILPWARSADNEDAWHTQLLKQVAKNEGFRLDVPIGKLAKKHIEIILHGTGEERYKIKWDGSGGTNTWHAKFEGVVGSLMRRYEQTDSDFIRREIEEYMDDKPCQACKGLRLKPESLAVTIRGLNIADIGAMSIQDAYDWTRGLQEGAAPSEGADSTLYQFFKFAPIKPADDDLSENERAIAKQVFKEILARLTFLVSVGLNYLSLTRSARTLSGGESQRIRLASQIGTGLTGVLYVLDEPSIGLHQRDNDRLLKTLQRLRDLGNTVLVVEHDADTIRLADWVIDIGPGAGEHGGRVVFSGEPKDLIQSGNTDTGAFLSGKRKIDLDEIREEIRALRLKNTGEKTNTESHGKSIRILGVTHNNLKSVDAEIPLGKFVAVTGVSGSGKSSMVNDVLSRVLAKEIHGAKSRPGAYKKHEGLSQIDKAIVIDQSPIGRTPRSNPATYTGLFAGIRDLFAMTQEAKVRGYKPGRFSFNVKGGRCENCQGDGLIRIEMQFLPDVYVTCEVCKGKRYNRDTLQIDYKGKNIAEVLEMTVEEAYNFFLNLPALSGKLKTLLDVGLGYIRLGQSATTLSGGEAQRMKLSAELSRRSTGRSFYILDEPSTGLHFEDVRKLLIVLHSLVMQGNTVLVIEHNLDIVKNADWIIDMGPEGGEAGGRIMAQGTVRDVAETEGSYTGEWLKKLLIQEGRWERAARSSAGRIAAASPTSRAEAAHASASPTSSSASPRLEKEPERADDLEVPVAAARKRGRPPKAVKV